MNKEKESEYMKGLRAIIKQAEREKWNTLEISMAVQCHRFAIDVKFADSDKRLGIRDK